MNVRQGSTTFLKVIIFLIGIAILVLCIYWFPELAIKEIKTHSGYYSLYPILGLAYGCCIMVSASLYQWFKLLSYIERNSAFTELSLKSLKIIKKCALGNIFIIILGILYLKILSKFTGDDPAGPIALSIIGIFVTIIITAIVDVFEKLLENILYDKAHSKK